MGNYITFESLENRLSVAVVRRIFDDNNDGEPDSNPLLQIIDDAERWFESVAVAVYPDLAALRAQGGPSAASIVMDCAVGMSAQRFPKAVCREWQPLIDWADKQLMRLRKGEIKLPVVGPPNPPANTGGRVELSGPASVGVDNESVFQRGFGIF